MLIFAPHRLNTVILHVLNFYLDNGVMSTPKRRFLSFAFTVLSFKKSLLIKIYSKLNFPSKTNHKIFFHGHQSIFYNIDFSTSRIITVNINRHFENVTISINFNDPDRHGERSYAYNMQYKTLLIN